MNMNLINIIELIATITLVDIIFIFLAKIVASTVGQFVYGDYESLVSFFLSRQDFLKSAI